MVVAALDKKFNEKDLHAEIILDDQFGLAPRVKPPATGRRYPSAWPLGSPKAYRNDLELQQARNAAPPFMSALTRICARYELYPGPAGAYSDHKWEALWTQPGSTNKQALAAAGSFADWPSRLSGSPQRSCCRGCSRTLATDGRTAGFSWRLVEESEWKNQGDGSAATGTQTAGLMTRRPALPNPIDLQDAAVVRRNCMRCWAGNGIS